MPKGVEHIGVLGGGNEGLTLPISVMPKGVEHEEYVSADTVVETSYFCNAERR